MISKYNDEAGKISRTEKTMDTDRKNQSNDDSIYVLKRNWKKNEQWKFPLHFIDFEIVPCFAFPKGRKPMNSLLDSHHLL